MKRAEIIISDIWIIAVFLTGVMCGHFATKYDIKEKSQNITQACEQKEK